MKNQEEKAIDSVSREEGSVKKTLLYLLISGGSMQYYL